MSRGTYDSSFQKRLLHIPTQAQLVILLEIRNNLCRSLKRFVYKTFHTFKTLQPNERKNQKLFQMFRKFESFKFCQMHPVSCFRL